MLTPAPGWLAELDRRTGARPVDLVEAALQELDGTPAPLRWWTGVSDLDWDGRTWTALGDLVQITPSQSTADGSRGRATLTVAATPELLQLVQQRRTQGLPLNTWRGWLADDGSLITPMLVSSMLIDEITVTFDARESRLTVALRDWLSELDRPRMRRLGPESQALRDPLDHSLDALPTMDKAEIDLGGYWKRETDRAG